MIYNFDFLYGNVRLRRVMIAVVAAFLVLTSYSIYSSYSFSLAQAQKASLMRLGGIVNSLALQIDGDQHLMLMQKYPQVNAIKTNQQDSDYLQIHEMLNRNQVANMLPTPVYTVIYDSISHRYQFGVTSSLKPYFRHPYRSYPASLMRQKKEQAMIPMYHDEHGMWLSAYAPIKTHTGKVVGYVQADEKFDAFLQQARMNIQKNILISILVFVFLLVLLVQIIYPSLKREQEDKHALEAAYAQNRAMSEQLKLSLEKITAQDQFRKEMIANISHDLRTPMASIMGYLETILVKGAQLAPAEQDTYLNIVWTESKRLNHLLDELFELSILESGHLELHPEPFNIMELAQDILQKYRIGAQTQQVRMLTQFDEQLPYVYADLRWIDRVLQNLLDNALRYVDSGGFINFNIIKRDDKIQIKVCNSGPPIAEEHLDHVFDRFFKSANSKKDSVGLGLAIVKKIIDLHGESIVVEVDKDLTTFRFTLPVYSVK
jgi:signal transduction histidine kinase